MRTLLELKNIMIECFNADDVDEGRAKFQGQLTDEELQMLRNYRDEKKKAYSDLTKEYKLGLIGKNEYYDRCNALDEKYAKEFI